MTLGMRYHISNDPKSQISEPKTWNLYTYLVTAKGLHSVEGR